jgi:hypothetical protein
MHRETSVHSPRRHPGLEIFGFSAKVCGVFGESL